MSSRREAGAEERIRIDYLMIACELLYQAFCLPANEPGRNLKIANERARLESITGEFLAPSIEETEAEDRIRLENLLLASERMYRALCLPAEEPDRALKIVIARARLEYITECFFSRAHPTS